MGSTSPRSDTKAWGGLRERVLRSLGMGDLYDMLASARESIARLTAELAEERSGKLWLAGQLEDLQRAPAEAAQTTPDRACVPGWPEIEHCLRLHLTPADVVFDIGANQGVYTRLCAEMAREVHAFEPHPDLFPRLRDSAREPNATLVNKAISDRVGTVEFNLDARPGANGVASSLMELFDLKAANQIRKVLVESTTVDTYCADTGIVPTFLKIDVEGAEPLVIAGAEQTIRRYRPKILFEFWENHWPRFRPTFEALEPFYHLVRVADGASAPRYYRSGSHEGGADILALPLPH